MTVSGKKNEYIKSFFGLLIAIIWVFPVLWIILSSFKSGQELFAFPMTIFPKSPNLQNYVTALFKFNFVMYTANTAFITIIATAVTLLMSSMCGFALAKYKYPWLRVLFVCLLATTMLPTEIIMRPSFTVIYKLGLYDTLWACIVPTVGTMTGVFLMRQFFVSVPNELLEAARIDGAHEGRIFIRLMLPLCQSQLAILGIFSVKWRWNDFIWPLITLRSPDKYTLQIALRTLSGAEAVDWTTLLSASVLTMLPVLILFIIFNRQIMSTNVASGFKG